MRPALATLCLLCCACGSRTDTPWAVDGGVIRDPQGRVVVMRGANVSGHHKFPPFFDFHHAADFEHMRVQWGMNAVRYLTTWAAVEPQSGQIDHAYLDQLASRVGEATDAGLLVFVDMHQDLYGLGFPGGDGAPDWTCDAGNYAAYTPQDPWFLGYLTPQVAGCVDGFWGSRELQQHFADAWAAVALRLKDDQGVIGFDPLNEPYWGSAQLDLFEPRKLAPFYAKVIGEVRAQCPQWLVFAEPASSRNLGFASHLPPLGVDGVVYAPHSYDGDAEQGKPFTPAHEQAVYDNLAALKAEADTLGAALVIGEYGGQIQLDGIRDYMATERHAMDQQLAGATYWDDSLGGGYALLDDDGGERPVLLDEVAVPAPDRIAGTPVSFGFESDGGTFSLRYRPDRSLSAPTIIAVPERTWPGGFDVGCDGCKHHAAPGQLIIDEPATGDEVELTLRGISR
ncbi:MAG: cellulase family glycosylhydrolase [Myxococcaceae bacterium]